MRKARLSQVHWGLIVKTSIVLSIRTLVLGLALTLLLFALRTWSHMDSPSAVRASDLIAVLLVVTVTGYGALRVARMVERAPFLHGVLVGVAVALLSLLLDVLFSRAIEWAGVALYALMAASGVLGGILGSRGRARS